MDLYRKVKRTFNLLVPRCKVRFLLLTGLQMILGLLDLLAILIVAAFSLVGSSYLGVSELPNSFREFLRITTADTGSLGRALVCLVSIAVTLIIVKSILALLVLKKVFLFLANQNVEISKQLARRFMNSSYETISARSSQEATYAVGRGLHISEILGSATVVISEITLLSLMLGTILILEPLLGINILLYFSIVYFMSQRKLDKWLNKNSLIFSQSNVKGDQIFQEGVTLYKELYVANRLNEIVQRFSSMRAEVANATANIQLINYIPKFTFESALVIGACLVGIQSVLLDSTQSALTSLVVFFAVGSRVMPSLLRLQSATNAIQSFSGASEISFELIEALDQDMKETIISNSTPANLDKKFDGAIQMIDVDYHYGTEGKFSIKDVSIAVSRGSSLAIVGRTGCGKSTIVNLLLGILKPTSGEISISGMEPSLAIQIWPGAIGYVPQDIAFLNGSVRENVAIGYSTQEIDDEQIWNCLELVHLSSLFSSSELGLDALIGERGIKLSGGQRQRLGIARALYSDPQLLVLDEATSALDAETEEAISKTIHNLSKRITLIVVAHRISTLQNVNQVIYLDEGQVRARGSFAEVRAAVPDFENQASLMGL